MKGQVSGTKQSLTFYYDNFACESDTGKMETLTEASYNFKNLSSAKSFKAVGL